MTLYVDLDLGRFVAGAGQGGGPAQIQHKRGDGGELAIQFCRGSALVELGAGAAIYYEGKLRGQYDADPLIQAKTFAVPVAANGEYLGALNYDVSALDAAFFVDANTANDVAVLTAMFEVSWKVSGKGWLSTDTVNGVIENDVVRSGGAILPQLSVPGTADAGEAMLIRKQLRLDTAGDAEAEVYGTLHSLGNSETGRISDFLNGLASLGLKSNFKDAAFYGQRFQPSGSATAFSLLGTGNLAINSAPVMGANGFTFDGVDDYLYNPIFANTTGDWSILTSAARQVYAPTVGQFRAVQFFDTSPLGFALQMANGTNWQTYTNLGGTAASMNGARSPNQASFETVTMVNDKTAGAGSFSYRTSNGDADIVSGRGPLIFDKLAVGAGTTNASTFSNFFDGHVGFWSAWDSLLTASQIDAVNALIGESVAPKYRFVMEGDSIAGTVNGWSKHIESTAGFLGGNIDLVNRAVPGETSRQAVARIGLSTGIDDALFSADFPTWCLIQAGSNDSGASGTADTTGAVDSLGYLRQLWEAARTRGLKVIACTVPMNSNWKVGASHEYWNTVSGTKSIDVLADLNARIRADAARYDYLLDVEQVGITGWGANYFDDTTCFYDGVHPGPAEASMGPAAMLALYELVKNDLP